jgi:two-component system, OmpR family, response regulator RegX3
VTNTSATSRSSEPVDRLAVGGVVLDRAAHLVTVSGRPLHLAHQEFRLLELLMVNADRVLSPGFLLDSLWGPDFAGDPGTLAVHMLRLRKKLEREPGGTRHLRTVRRVGYIFDTEPV